jgi:hypothetical protein
MTKVTSISTTTDDAGPVTALVVQVYAGAVVGVVSGAIAFAGPENVWVHGTGVPALAGVAGTTTETSPATSASSARRARAGPAEKCRPPITRQW